MFPTVPPGCSPTDIGERLTEALPQQGAGSERIYFMTKKILITGGAGFVGSHLADELLAHGYTVRVLDELAPQVHGHSGQRPHYLADDVELVTGDIRDPACGLAGTGGDRCRLSSRGHGWGGAEHV